MPHELVCSNLFSRFNRSFALTAISDDYGASNHQPPGFLLDRLFRSKKISKLRVTVLLLGIHRSPVNSPHKWPVTRKMFPFDDNISLQWPATFIVDPLKRWNSHITCLLINGYTHTSIYINTIWRIDYIENKSRREYQQPTLISRYKPSSHVLSHWATLHDDSLAGASREITCWRQSLGFSAFSVWSSWPIH